MPAEAIRQVGMGALFHDIGKLKLQSQITAQDGAALTKPEQNLMAQHPRYWPGAAGAWPVISRSRAKRIVQYHHEYPGWQQAPGLRGTQLDPLTQMVSLINEYDNLCHLQAKVPYSALGSLYKQRKAPVQRRSPRHADPPDGDLSPAAWCSSPTARSGLVMSVNASRLLYPAVLVYDPASRARRRPSSDLDEAGLTIAKVIHPKRLLPGGVPSTSNPRTRISYYSPSTASSLIGCRPPKESAMRIEIISTGDEIVTGLVVDTNAAWLQRPAAGAGLAEVRRRLTVGTTSPT